MTRRAPLLLLAVLVSLTCVGIQGPVDRSGVVPDTRATAMSREFPSQRIYRVRYQGPGGGASFRLAARLASPDAYRLAASALVGRTLWTLDYDAPRTRFVDYRAGAACTTDRPLALPDVALGTLSLADLALVLVGHPPSAGAASTVDPASPGTKIEEPRSLTVEWSDLRVTSWTIWSGGRPLVWFLAESGGGILSHRDGTQFRWRETGREAMEDTLPPLPVPEGFRRTSCRDLETSVLAEK